jgi:succinoglycan biosynthesis transport protein ExoP
MTEAEVFSPSAIGMRELASIARRRLLWLMAPAVLGLLAGIVAGLVIQPIYRSSATLLIDAQQIPATVVAPASTNFADERVAKIRERILSRTNLAGLIAAENLYPRERAAGGFDNAVNRMRGAINVDLVSADQPGRGPNGSTIAFNLAYIYGDPRKAHDVLQRLTASFVAEDARLSTEQAMSATRFLQQRAEELRDQLVKLEERRRGIERRYAGSLPDQIGASAQDGAILRSQLAQIDSETQGILQQNGLLAARSQEIDAAANATPDALSRSQQKLAQLSAIYSDTHPDVIAARSELETIRGATRSSVHAIGAGPIAAEIASSRNRLGQLAGRRAGLQLAIQQAEQRAALQPEAAYELNKLERDYGNLKAQYQQIREKQLDAQVASNLQAEGKGERFSVVNAPDMPDSPIKPKRRQLAIMGLVAGLCFGVGVVAVWEFLAGLVHGPDGVMGVTGTKPLVSIPVITTSRQSDGLIGALRHRLGAILGWSMPRLARRGW